MELSEAEIEREIADSDEWMPPPSRFMRVFYVVVLVGCAVALGVSIVWAILNG